MALLSYEDDNDRRVIFASTACLPEKQPLDSRVSLYQGVGINAIELGAGVYVSKENLQQVTTAGGRFILHNYFPPPSESFVLNLASDKEAIRQKSLDLVFDALSWSARLGAPFYSVHAGFITDPTSFGKTSFVFPMPSSADETRFAMERFVATLEVALDRAQDLGIRILVENNVCLPELQGKLLLQTADEFLALFQALPAPNLGILLDTGHLNVTAHTLHFDPVSFVEKVAPYIGAFHVHENDGTADAHLPVRPGSWVLDVLRRPDFAGLPVVVEAKFGNIASLRRHIDWLKTELERE